jgi:hypothetical protein
MTKQIEPARKADVSGEGRKGKAEAREVGNFDKQTDADADFLGGSKPCKKRDARVRKMTRFRGRSGIAKLIGADY